MAQFSIPWGGIVTGDAGPYSDDQWTDIWESLSSIFANQGGVLRDRLNELAVTGATSPVSVNTGEAMVDGSWYENTASTTVAVPTPAVSTRIDRIVLRKSWAAQTVRIARVAGVEGAGAPALTQVDGVTWEVPLAQASITTGGAITLTDEREFSNLPIAVGFDDASGNPVGVDDNAAADGSSAFAARLDHVHGLASAGASAGDVPVSDGAGGVNWGPQFIDEVADQSPSAVANVDITGLSVGGDLHIIGWLRPVTDGASLRIRLNNYSGASDYRWTSVIDLGSGTTDATSTGDNAIQVTLAAGTTAVGNGTDEGISFHIVIPVFGQLIGSKNPILVADVGHIRGTNAAVPVLGQAMGQLLKAEAVNRVTIFFSSGNIQEGRIRFYTTGD